MGGNEDREFCFIAFYTFYARTNFLSMKVESGHARLPYSGTTSEVSNICRIGNLLTFHSFADMYDHAILSMYRHAGLVSLWLVHYCEN